MFIFRVKQIICRCTVLSLINFRKKIRLNFKWAPMRKIRYDEAKTMVADTYLPEPVMGQWIPFWCIWDQSGLNVTDVTELNVSNQPSFIHREVMYFTDA